jgi:hypothetical protein
MKTKTKKPAKREFQVYRYWSVDYRSIAYVNARTVEEAIKLAEDDEDFDDQESCDGSDGPTEIGQIIEVTPEGLEIEHPVPAADDATVYLPRAQAAALLSSVEVALTANGGDCPDSVRESLLAAVETLNEEFGFGL